MLQHARRGDHSSRSRFAPGLQQPTRGSQTSWASSPLLFGLAPRGVCRAPDVATGAVGSYPTVSPLPSASTATGAARRFSFSRPPRRIHRRFIFCGTFRSRNLRQRLRAPRDAAPWRYQARCPAESGLSSRLSSCDDAQRSPGPLAAILYRRTGRSPAHRLSRDIIYGGILRLESWASAGTFRGLAYWRR